MAFTWNDLLVADYVAFFVLATQQLNNASTDKRPLETLPIRCLFLKKN